MAHSKQLAITLKSKILRKYIPTTEKNPIAKIAITQMTTEEYIGFACRQLGCFVKFMHMLH